MPVQGRSHAACFETLVYCFFVHFLKIETTNRWCVSMCTLQRVTFGLKSAALYYALLLASVTELGNGDSVQETSTTV